MHNTHGSCIIHVFIYMFMYQGLRINYNEPEFEIINAVPLNAKKCSSDHKHYNYAVHSICLFNIQLLLITISIYYLVQPTTNKMSLFPVLVCLLSIIKCLYCQCYNDSGEWSYRILCNGLIDCTFRYLNISVRISYP